MKNTVSMPRLLVVSRDSAVLRSLRSAVQTNGWQIDIAGSAWEAIDKVQTDAELDMLLIDAPKGHTVNVEGMRSLRRLRPDLPMMFVGHADDSSLRQKAISMGALGYLVAPFSESELKDTVRRNLFLREAADARITSDDIEKIDEERCFVALSPSMRKIRHQVGMLAEADLPVYISGERGTGKETVARLLHSLSLRSGFGFEKVDCAALPEDALERELFGCKISGAVDSQMVQQGKLEKSAKGRLFLREITQMPTRLQSRLVQALHRGEFVRPFSPLAVRIDVAIVASSSLSADEAVAAGKLDPELCRYFGAYEVQLPPLRDRKMEISPLSGYFMHRISRKYHLAPREFSSAMLEAWGSNDWPGNLSALEQEVKSYLIAGDKMLQKEYRPSQHPEEPCFPVTHNSKMSQIELPPYVSATGIAGYKSLRALLRSVKEEAEKSAITMALEKTCWNRKAAARLLKTSYRTVLYKIEQYKLNQPEHLVMANSAATEASRVISSGTKQSNSSPKFSEARGD